MAGHPYFFPGRAQDISLVRKRRRRWRNVRPFDSRAPNIVVKRVAKINKFRYGFHLHSVEKQYIFRTTIFNKKSVADAWN